MCVCLFFLSPCGRDDSPKPWPTRRALLLPFTKYLIRSATSAPTATATRLDQAGWEVWCPLRVCNGFKTCKCMRPWGHSKWKHRSWVSGHPLRRLRSGSSYKSCYLGGSGQYLIHHCTNRYTNTPSHCIGSCRESGPTEKRFCPLRPHGQST